MQAFVFDIETVPDAALLRRLFDLEGSDAEVARGAREKLSEGRAAPVDFLPAHLHRVVAIGGLGVVLGETPRITAFARAVGETVEGEVIDERRVIEEFWAKAQGSRFVSYNGRGFDLPVLELRSLHLGLSVPYYFDERRRFESYRYRYSAAHLDLIDFLTNDGALRPRMSLHHASALVGLPGKGTIDGSQVEDLVAEGRVNEVKQYCLTDVFQTALLFLRVELLRGALDQREYAAAVAAVADYLRRSLQARPDAAVMAELLVGLVPFFTAAQQQPPGPEAASD